MDQKTRHHRIRSHSLSKPANRTLLSSHFQINYHSDRLFNPRQSYAPEKQHVSLGPIKNISHLGQLN